MKRPCCSASLFIYTKTCRKPEIKLEHAPYWPIVNFCLSSSTCPCHWINYLWLSFFFFFLSPIPPLPPQPCSSVMHAVLAIIKLARVWCFEYGTDDECIISWCSGRASFTQVGSHLCVSFQPLRREFAWLTASTSRGTSWRPPHPPPPSPIHTYTPAFIFKFHPQQHSNVQISSQALLSVVVEVNYRGLIPHQSC